MIHISPAISPSCMANADVSAIPDAEWGEAIKAVVKRREGASLTDQQVIQFLGERVADYKRPRSVDFVAEVPRNPSGKLLKREIRAPYWEGRERRV